MKSFIVQNEEFYHPAGRVKPSKMEDFTRFHRPKWRVLQSKMKGFTIQNERFYPPKSRVLPSTMKSFASKNPRFLSLLQGKFSQKVKNSKSQKVFDFSNFPFFSTFRAEISWNGNFSTFRLFAVENRATSQKSTQLGQSYQEIQGPMEVALPHLYDIMYLSILHHIIRIQSHDFPSSRKNASP